MPSVTISVSLPVVVCIFLTALVWWRAARASNGVPYSQYSQYDFTGLFYGGTAIIATLFVWLIYFASRVWIGY